ncbi:glycosyltransferase family 8 protein [Clostridium sp. ZBS2]|uniref:glycosyltransferase family 8 protein n=1 Tax=Clostridium sp. ZBS2 TaxID=2949976 RepID=UPI0020794B98|nr:glycosyltransferase family 8 protein [Clostridium sp. ZBS2]
MEYDNTIDDILEPIFAEKSVSIVLMSSNYYVPYLTATIKSIIDNNDSEKNYDIVVLQNEISLEYQNVILDFFYNINNVKIRFYNPEGLLKKTKLYISSRNYAREAYYRLLVPWILKGYDKTLVIDCDVVINEDVSLLYNTDINNYFVAGVKDIVFEGILEIEYDAYKYSKDILNLKEAKNYINTGVILLNLEKIRECFTIEYIINFAESNKFRFQEQDIINSLFSQNILYLSMEWNCYVKLSRDIIMCIDASSEISKNIYNNINDNAKIYHFAGTPKPWEDPEIDKSYMFWRLVKDIPFYEKIIARMVKYNANYKHNQTSMNRFFPFGTKRRMLIDKILKKGSKRRKIIKKIVDIILK